MLEWRILGWNGDPAVLILNFLQGEQHLIQKTATDSTGVSWGVQAETSFQQTSVYLLMYGTIDLGRTGTLTKSILGHIARKINWKVLREENWVS